MRFRTLAIAFVVGTVAAATPALAQTPVERGMKVFAEQECLACHSVAGKGDPKGPIEEGIAKLSAEEIHEWLINPDDKSEMAGAYRKPSMKSYQTLPEEDLHALVAYLMSLKKK